MKLGEIFGDALKYPISNPQSLIIVGVIFLIANLTTLLAQFGVRNSAFATIWAIVALIVSILLVGYGLSILKNAIDFCKQIKSKGYNVYTNPVSITTYSDKEMLELIDLVNELEPSAMSLVDTYGLLHKDRLFRYFYLLDNNLKKSIAIGYHSHNNFQLAYSNSIELLNIKTNRNIIRCLCSRRNRRYNYSNRIFI